MRSLLIRKQIIKHSNDLYLAPSSSTPRKARLSTLQLQGGEDACGGIGKKDAAARTEMYRSRYITPRYVAYTLQSKNRHQMNDDGLIESDEVAFDFQAA